jgi:transcriptional regulator with XRE-family HTH domain
MSAPRDSARSAATGLFRNLGTALLLMRGLRRKSQGWVAREAGIGKSQLSKYETGRELPKLDSLGKVLNVLGVGALEFFYTLHFIDQRSVAGAQAAPGIAVGAGGDSGLPLFLAALPAGHALLSAATERAFTESFASLLALHRRVFEDLLAARGS